MAQYTTVPKLNFEYWLDKAIEWGQATTLESQKDVCLHLPQLQEFLCQLHETLKDLQGSVVAIQQFPLIGQLLGRLCWNPFVIGYDESQKTLMWCLCCLYSSEPQNPVELKANSWIRWVDVLPVVETTELDGALQIVFSLVTELRENQFNGLNIQGRQVASSLWSLCVHHLNQLHQVSVLPVLVLLELDAGGVSSEQRVTITSLGLLATAPLTDPGISLSTSHVNAVSIFCVPLITLPDVTPLLEALLLYHGGSSKEILCPEFLEGVNDAFLKKKISLSDSAVFSLWLRHLPGLEKATLHLLDQLVSIQLNSLEEVARMIKDSLLGSHLVIKRDQVDQARPVFPKVMLAGPDTLVVLHMLCDRTQDDLFHIPGTTPQAASHPAIFRTVNEIFKNALLETDGTSEVMTVIQVFTQLFLQARQNENNQGLCMLILCHPACKATAHCVATGGDHWVRASSLTDLFEIWFLVACFGEWVDIAAEQLLKAAVEPDALLWLLAFYYCPQNENQQRTQTMVGNAVIVEVQAIYSHLMMLFSCTDLSLKDLEAAVHRIMGIEQCCNQYLIIHLLTNFLLFSSGGHMVAQECIDHITNSTDTSKEVYSLLIRTAYRFKHNGEENQRAVKLLNELLQKRTWKV
ncbi:Fanconi anemia complementation group C [Willisornis vidua]|uniref:Fanconi anemia complementation group C n=1 Tax=Willisornis vidua TaxID=1566151 RepID=A0ABQ9CKF5_9PASS|nr:Fanconi anemia complementation group C [Willisornis vidua]